MTSSTDRRTVARFVLFAGTTAGVLAMVFYFFLRPDGSLTFDMFYGKAGASMNGSFAFVDEHGSYHYLPIVILLFYPYVWLFDLETALLVHRIVSVLVAAGYGIVTARFLASRIDIEPVDWALIVAFLTVNVYTIPIVDLGNVGTIFVAPLGLGFVLLEIDEDWGGVAWALTSLIKIFPAMWGWYMLKIRRWRAVGAAIATGVGGTICSILLFGFQTHVEYLTGGAGGRIRLYRFADGRSPDNEMLTPIRPLAQVFTDVDPYFWVPVVIVVIGLCMLLVYTVHPVETLLDRTGLVTFTVVSILFVMPTTQDLDVYLVFAPLVLLLYLENDPTVHTLYTIGGLFVSYNVGRSVLESITASLFGEAITSAVMSVGELVLAFASIPLYGLLMIYAGTLLKTSRRAKEVESIERVHDTVGRITGRK